MPVCKESKYDILLAAHKQYLNTISSQESVISYLDSFHEEWIYTIMINAYKYRKSLLPIVVNSWNEHIIKSIDNKKFGLWESLNTQTQQNIEGYISYLLDNIILFSNQKIILPLNTVLFRKRQINVL
jgi:hypothetical protein